MISFAFAALNVQEIRCRWELPEHPLAPDGWPRLRPKQSHAENLYGRGHGFTWWNILGPVCFEQCSCSTFSRLPYELPFFNIRDDHFWGCVFFWMTKLWHDSGGHYSITHLANYDLWSHIIKKKKKNTVVSSYHFLMVWIYFYFWLHQVSCFRSRKDRKEAVLRFTTNPNFKKITQCLSFRIHPRNKQDVAYRLTLGARAVAYNESNVAFQGPFPSQILSTPTYINVTYDQTLHVTPSADTFQVRLFSNIS